MLDVIAAASNRLLVLTGEPGSGKSTLMRYLLTGIIDPPVDRESGEPLPWTPAFKDAFPLLIELQGFYALRRSGECENFLEYVDCMGKNDAWFLDQHAVNDYLDSGPSLVMFDGLDEIFDTAHRERVMQEIAGFAQRYPHARIIVTSRPVGYEEQVLRNAGFSHFGIQDLDDGQIETFIGGWFALTFPQQPQQADQRIERVLGSVQQSKPIRLLAGNPMLLTIMALLAREEELPRERAKFYEKAVEVLCHHWDANRKLELPEDRYLNADDKKALLRRIAMRMQAGKGGLKGNIIQEGDLEQEIQTFLIDEQWQPNAPDAKKAARRMIHQLRERNYLLCLRGPRLYGFVHRTFLEFLTAAEYVRRFDRQPQQMTIEQLIELFDQHCRDDDWREVLRLICGQIDEQFVGQIVEHLATRTDLEQSDGEAPPHELPFAILCLMEVRNRGRLQGLEGMLFEAIMEIAGKTCISAYQTGYYGTWGAGQPAENEWFGNYLWPKFFAAYGEDIDSAASQDLRPLRGIIVGVTPPEALLKSLQQFLRVNALRDENEYSRGAALKGLAEKWPGETTRSLLEERAVQDENEYPRHAALQALAEKWPDERTRGLLAERAVHDEHDVPRSAALQALAEKWPDETTRNLLEERALEDVHPDPRIAALQALTEKWPDDTTRNLLEERAADGSLTADRRAELYVAIGKMHSKFGGIVFTEDLDDVGPYLHPAEPISRQHMERAAEKADVPPDKIDETVRSLSAHMGWDITKGASR